MNTTLFLQELKNYGLKNEIPNISQANAFFLRDLIQISGAKNMLEIGTANGYSSIHFALELAKNGGHLTTIEFSEKSFTDAQNNFQKAGVENITSLLGNALDIVPTLQETFDFVFIDGMKRRSLDFLQLAREKTHEKSIIVIDDVIKFREKMVGLFEYLEEKNIRHHILPIDGDDGICMIVR